MLTNSPVKAIVVDQLYSLPGRDLPDSSIRSRRGDPSGRRESDVDYFRRRAAEERTHAQAASDPQVRGLHLDLAERYVGLAAAIAEAEDKIG